MRTPEEELAAGKAAYEAWRNFWQPAGGTTDPAWEDLTEIDITVWCAVAKAVRRHEDEVILKKVSALKDAFLGVFPGLSTALIRARALPIVPSRIRPFNCTVCRADKHVDELCPHGAYCRTCAPAHCARCISSL